MLKFYPFASGSQYTASFALTASLADTAQFLAYVQTASFADTGNLGPKGFRGAPDICIITQEQYAALSSSFALIEDCPFPPR